jgi:uncharacterized protein YkwD
MPKKKKQTLSSKIKSQSKSRKIVFIVIFAVIAAAVISNIFAAMPDKTGALYIASEKIAIQYTDEKPVVISKDTSGRIKYESRGKEITITAQGNLYCTPENQVITTSRKLSAAELKSVKNQLSTTRYTDDKTLTSGNEAVTIGNTEEIKTVEGNSVGRRLLAKGKSSGKFNQAELVLTNLCKNTKEQLTPAEVPVFKTQEPTTKTSFIAPLKNQLIPKASAGPSLQPLPKGMAYNTMVEDNQAWNINNARVPRRIAPLTRSKCMNLAARNWSIRMAAFDTFKHSALSSTVEEECGTGWWAKLGENIGKTGNGTSGDVIVTTATSEQMFAAFMNSPGHRANILDPAYQRMGVGAVTYLNPKYPYKILWVTQLFVRCQGSCANK